MKKSFLISTLLLWTASAFALTPEFTAYMRAATGHNGLGGAQECMTNKGSSGNEFRLGNECGIYSEFSFGGYVLKPENETAPFFALHSTFAFIYGNREDFEADPSQAWIPRELYVEGGRVDGQDFYVWMGKRFYRWSSIDMNDFFAVDMSGPGVGVVSGKTSVGTWSAAIINNTPSREFNTSTGTITTGIGNATKTSYHLRLDDMESSLGKWSYWLAGGTTSATQSTGGTSYRGGTSGMFAVRNNHALLGGKNEIGVAYGQGVMSNFSAQGELVKDCDTMMDPTCNVPESSRVRAWDGLAFEGDRWTGQVAAVFEDWNMGRGVHAKWTSLGIRPIYWFTEHMSLMAEAGTSTVADDSDGLGSRRLTRFTIAPQMSFGKGNFSRPVFRAFYSRTNWSDNNKVSAVKTAFANRTEKDSVGVQTEIWF